MTYYIAANGITNIKPSPEELPQNEQVKFCKKILEHISENKGFYRSSSSYGYKHVLETNFESGYISNGAFIQAAKDLGLAIERWDDNSLNAGFKFSTKDLKLALLKHLTNQHSLKITEKESEEIKEQLISCRTKTSTLTLNNLSQLYKNYCNLEIGVLDILKITNDRTLNIKYNFNPDLNRMNNENYAAESTINVSLSKLAKLLYTVHENKKQKNKMKT